MRLVQMVLLISSVRGHKCTMSLWDHCKQLSFPRLGI